MQQDAQRPNDDEGGSHSSRMADLAGTPANGSAGGEGGRLRKRLRTKGTVQWKSLRVARTAAAKIKARRRERRGLGAAALGGTLVDLDDEPTDEDEDSTSPSTTGDFRDLQSKRNAALSGSSLTRVPLHSVSKKAVDPSEKEALRASLAARDLKEHSKDDHAPAAL